MKLSLLKAHFTKYGERLVTPGITIDDITYTSGHMRWYDHVQTLPEADGLWFLCPQCYILNNGEVGTHWHAIGFRGRCPPNCYSKGSNGEDTRWDVSGTCLDDLVLTPSIQTVGGCGWHGWIKNGCAE